MFSTGAEEKSSLKRARVALSITETGRPIHEQGEAKVKLCGGPNTHLLKKMVMTCG